MSDTQRCRTDTKPEGNPVDRLHGALTALVADGRVGDECAIAFVLWLRQDSRGGSGPGHAPVQVQRVTVSEIRTVGQRAESFRSIWCFFSESTLSRTQSQKHLVRPTLTISGIRGPFSCGKRPLGSCLMASSAPGTLVTGAALDVALCVVDAAPHQAVDRSVPLSSANLCVSARCLWAGPRTRRCMDASKLMLPASVLQGLPRASDGCCGFNLRCALPAASPHARWRRSSARSVVSAASCWKRSAHDFGA